MNGEASLQPRRTSAALRQCHVQAGPSGGLGSSKKRPRLPSHLGRPASKPPQTRRRGGGRGQPIELTSGTSSSGEAGGGTIPADSESFPATNNEGEKEKPGQEIFLVQKRTFVASKVRPGGVDFGEQEIATAQQNNVVNEVESKQSEPASAHEVEIECATLEASEGEAQFMEKRGNEDELTLRTSPVVFRLLEVAVYAALFATIFTPSFQS